MARRRIIAGNWKMNKTPSEAVALCEELKDLVKNDAVDVVYCVPAIDIVPVVNAVKGTNVHVGAENFYIVDSGAYTGEISAPMLKDAGVEYIIIGHSERRDIFGENDILINQKVKKAFASGLTPILCCGESLELRNADTYKEWIERQITWDLDGVTADQVKKLVIAYEPIWAIGTG
ncbi:MAG: triosephosphate isomerase, partial [Butyrivibrio sp.]|nr:triosephosphate isomerase [Butyrivibrio sp.]